MAFRDGETWYRVSGALDAGGPAPLLVVHGGPGGSHDYLLPLADMFADRPVVLYDQFGNGNSSHRPGWGPSAWSIGLFAEELAALVAHLRLDRFHLLGHSWGGMLAAEYALRGPERLASLILSDSAASGRLIEESFTGLLAEIRSDSAAELARAGAPGSPEYAAAAWGIFLARHMCRVDPMPPGLVRFFEVVAAEPGVITAVLGLENGAVTGSLREWSTVDRLPGLAVPTLAVGGEFDELQPSAWEPFATRIPGARSHVLPGASHMPFLEVPEEYRAVVAPFLREHDA